MTPEKELTLTEKAVAAMRAAVNAVVEDHRLRGEPLVIWRDGKVVKEMPPTANEVRESEGDYHASAQHRGPE